MKSFTGGCLCGEIRYQITAEAGPSRICWCRDCQKIASNGTVNVIFPSDAIKISGAPGQHVLQQGLEALAGRGEHGRVRAAVKQRHARPVLQRLDVATQRRLRNVARLCRAREVAGLGQREEILQPFEVEGSVAWAHGVVALARR